MSIRIYEDIGAAKLNNSQKIGRVESVGPITVVVANLSTLANCVVSFLKEKAGTPVYSDKDTNVPVEASGYTGNGATLVFNGQSLNNVPIIPRSLVLTPVTSGPVLKDLYGDGFVYMPNGTTKAGTINYFTGSLTLNYPAGSPPDGVVNAAYRYQNSALVRGGQKNFGIVSGLPDEALAIYAACDHKDGARVKVESAATWA